jgi:hypothetical protein
MSQDDQNRDRKNQGEGWEDSTSEPSTRESRTDSSNAQEPKQGGTSRPDQSSDLEDIDEMDEDRDEDDRAGYGGGSNRRRSIN